MKFALKQTPLQVQQTAAGKARPTHIWYHTALAHLIEKKFVKKWCSLVMLGTLQERLHFPVLQNKVSTPNFQHPCSFKEEIHKKINMMILSALKTVVLIISHCKQGSELHHHGQNLLDME
jgi:hypothetical protein